MLGSNPSADPGARNSRASLRKQGQSRTPPLPISAPGSALGLLPSIALSSAQAMSSLREAREKHQTAGMPNRAFDLPLLWGLGPHTPRIYRFVAKMALKKPL